MSFPSYVIDLDLPEAARWAEVISCEKAAAHRLVQEATAELEQVPQLLRWLFARLYQAFGGLYRGEIEAWAEVLDVSVGTATLLNCAYELSHLRWSRAFGCTAGIRWVEGLGLVHARTLDWPLPSITKSTCLFRFRRGPREFLAVGAPGHVGVLSGMLPRAYSVTINWAPPGTRPTFDFGPAFLLRDTLESCDTFEAAITALKKTPLSTSVFFTVCGTEKDQACVIERTQLGAAIRAMKGSVLVQANHHVAKRLRKHNEELHEREEGETESFYGNSSRRLYTLEAALAQLSPTCALVEVGRALEIAPVLNEQTCQQMVFCPRAGAIKMWRPGRGRSRG